MNKETLTKYSLAQLKAAFEKVQCRHNWKNPIYHIMPVLECDDDLIREAIIFYTASDPTFTMIGDGFVKIKAPGYYISVGS